MVALLNRDTFSEISILRITLRRGLKIFLNNRNRELEKSARSIFIPDTRLAYNKLWTQNYLPRIPICATRVCVEKASSNPWQPPRQSREFTRPSRLRLLRARQPRPPVNPSQYQRHALSTRKLGLGSQRPGNNAFENCCHRRIV